MDIMRAVDYGGLEMTPSAACCTEGGRAGDSTSAGRAVAEEDSREPGPAPTPAAAAEAPDTPRGAYLRQQREAWREQDLRSSECAGVDAGPAPALPGPTSSSGARVAGASPDPYIQSYLGAAVRGAQEGELRHWKEQQEAAAAGGGRPATNPSAQSPGSADAPLTPAPAPAPGPAPASHSSSASAALAAAPSRWCGGAQGRHTVEAAILSAATDEDAIAICIIAKVGGNAEHAAPRISGIAAAERVGNVPCAGPCSSKAFCRLAQGEEARQQQVQQQRRQTQQQEAQHQPAAAGEQSGEPGLGAAQPGAVTGCAPPCGRRPLPQRGLRRRLQGSWRRCLRWRRRQTSMPPCRRRQEQLERLASQARDAAAAVRAAELSVMQLASEKHSTGRRVLSLQWQLEAAECRAAHLAAQAAAWLDVRQAAHRAVCLAARRRTTLRAARSAAERGAEQGWRAVREVQRQLARCVASTACCAAAELWDGTGPASSVPDSRAGHNAFAHLAALERSLLGGWAGDIPAQRTELLSRLEPCLAAAEQERQAHMQMRREATAKINLLSPQITAAQRRRAAYGSRWWPPRRST